MYQYPLTQILDVNEKYYLKLVGDPRENSPSGCVKAILTDHQTLKLKLNDVLQSVFYLDSSNKHAPNTLADKTRQYIEKADLVLDHPLNEESKLSFQNNIARSLGITPGDAEKLISFLLLRPDCDLKPPTERLQQAKQRLEILQRADDIDKIKQLVVNADGTSVWQKVSMDAEQDAVVVDEVEMKDVKETTMMTTMVSNHIHGTTLVPLGNCRSVKTYTTTYMTYFVLQVENVEIPGVNFPFRFSKTQNVWDFTRIYEQILAISGSPVNSEDSLKHLKQNNVSLTNVLNTKFQFDGDNNVHFVGNTAQLLEFLGYLEHRFPVVAKPAMQYIRANFARFHAGDQSMHDNLNANATRNDPLRDAMRRDLPTGTYGPLPQETTDDAMDIEDKIEDPTELREKILQEVDILMKLASGKPLPACIIETFADDLRQNRLAHMHRKKTCDVQNDKTVTLGRCGWVYAVLSPDNPNHTKIGYTTQPEITDHTRNYNATSNARWNVIARISTTQFCELENWLHTLLKDLGRCLNGRELFVLDAGSATRVFNEVANFIRLDGAVDFAKIIVKHNTKLTLTPAVTQTNHNTK